MLSNITKIIQKLLMGFCILYGYNILVPSEALIPINLITVTITTIFGIPGVLSLIVIKVLIY